MNKITTLGIAALGLIGSACSVDMGQPQEEVGTSGEAVACNNDQATASIMAGMAVAAAIEMKRWLPQRDLECEGSSYNNNVPPVDVTGQGGLPDGLADYPGRCIKPPNRDDGYDQFRVGVSPKGDAKCPNHTCRNVRALLKLQRDASNGMIFGGQPVSPGVLRSRMEAAWGEQFTCINRPDNHMADNCPVEAHELAPVLNPDGSVKKVVGAFTCDGGFDFWYHASKQNSGGTVLLQYPGQLKNMLLWAGGSNNPFLKFENNGNDVKIDPVPGTTEGGNTTSGSCTVVSYNASRNTCGQVYSSTSMLGQCCTCNNVNKTFTTGTWADYYKCG